jgi:hypothetical protein
MRPHVVLCIASVLALGACAAVGTPVSGYLVPPAAAGQACPLSPDGPRFTISVSDYSGASVSAELRTSIADAIADVWGTEEQKTVRNPERHLQVYRELRALIPSPPHHMQRKWRVRPGDSAITFLTYRRGQVPELDIPEQGLREEFREWITTAVGRAVAQALKGRTSGTPLPLQFAGVDDREVTLELRFGWSPRPGAAVITFARQEREAWPRPGNRGPRYPDDYRVNNVEGEVLIGFIITATGAVDANSMRVIVTDGPLFTRSVLAALPAMRFDPAMMDCEPYALVAVQPFNFSLVR